MPVHKKTGFFWSAAKTPGLVLDTWLVEGDASGVRDALAMLAKKQWCGKRLTAVDSETTGLDPQMPPVRTRLLQLSDGLRVVLFDLWKLTKKGVGLINAFLEDPARIKVFHNGEFDLKFLMWHQGLGEIGPLFDTMIVSQLLSLGDSYHTKHDYASLVEEHLGMPVPKDHRRGWSDNTFTPGQIVYASNDAAHLIPLRAKLLEAVRVRGILRGVRVELEAVQPTARMELNGFKCDREKWLRLSNRAKAKLGDVEEKIFSMLQPKAGDNMALFSGVPTFNLNSVEQLKPRLKELGIKLPTVLDRDTGKITDTTVLDKMAQISGQHPVIKLIMEHRVLTKQVTSYGKGFLRFINPYDGKAHADFKQIGTPTCRYTASKPPLHGIPKESDHRECFVAEDGWTLVWGDYSQIELRVLAELSGDRNMIKAFVEGLDLHKQTASLIFNVPYGTVIRIQRRRAKDLNFGLPYGVGPKRFAERAGISEDEAKKIMGDHARKYPEENSYLKNAAAHARVNASCRTLSGKLITFRFDRNRPGEVSAVERYGKNYPIQGSAADINKRAIRTVHNVINGRPMRLVHNAHDEIVLEVREDVTEEAKAVLRDAMVAAGEEFLHRVPVVVDISSNRYWAKAKED